MSAPDIFEESRGGSSFFSSPPSIVAPGSMKSPLIGRPSSSPSQKALYNQYATTDEEPAQFSLETDSKEHSTGEPRYWSPEGDKARVSPSSYTTPPILAKMTVDGTDPVLPEYPGSLTLPVGSPTRSSATQQSVVCAR